MQLPVGQISCLVFACMLYINLILKTSYVIIVKRTFRCLTGTKNVGLWFSKKSCIDHIGYSNIDFARCKLD